MDTDFLKRRLRILHLEDNENDHLLVVEALAADGLDCEFVTAKSKAEFMDALAQGKFDLIISDYTLPSYDGVHALAAVQAKSAETPFIFFSGTIGEDLAVESLKDGATDYILKQKPGRLAAAVRRALSIAEERSRRKQAEHALRQSEERLHIIAKATNDVVWEWHLQTDRVWFGENFSAAFGHNVEPELPSERWFDFIHPDDKNTVVSSLCAMLAAGGRVWWNEHRLRRGDGSYAHIYDRASVTYDEAGKPVRLVGIKIDISERKEAQERFREQTAILDKVRTEHKLLEEQFLRAQRLESLGVLVSGIAHDLNNTLVPIMIGVEILQTEPLSEDAANMVRTMGNSARRSAEMIRQMLVFARGGEASKVHVQPARLLKEMGRVISDTFPKSIQCRVNAGKDLSAIYSIPTQMHQVLMNLCVNARDAMPERGTLTLAAENATLTAGDTVLPAGARPGKYVCISVTDTGTGMTPEQMGKLFQPFFTTKAPDKGTGLGLSTCQSIVKKHDGFITVHSQVNSGTEFKVYLPAADAKLEEPSAVPPTALPAGNGERILVVDDEEGVLAMTRAALENYGYAVSTAVNGLEAVSRFRENPDAIQLVITDHALPLMGGEAIIAALRKIRPDIKIILASGSDKEVEETLRTARTAGFIAKPFTTEQLLGMVHEALKK